MVGLAARDEDSDTHLLENVIMAGATGVIERLADRLVQGVKAQAGPNRFAEAIGIQLPDDPAKTEALSVDRKAALAAVALAAAAHGYDDPFNEPLAKKLIAAAGGDPSIAVLAVILWSDADTYSDWDGDNPNTRPRGLKAVWRAVIEQPPSGTEVLASVANSASADGYTAEGLALLRLAQARTDLRADTRANLASQFARWHRLPDEAQRSMDGGGNKADGYDIDGINVSIARARLYRGYDAKAAAIVVADSLKGLTQEAFYSYLGQENLLALEAAKATRELLSLAEAYLVRARRPNDDAKDKGEWFALASESFRSAGDKAKAVAAAREGVPLVAAAVTSRNMGQAITDKRQAAVSANGFGTAPVVALYRAGARDEAVATGFLIGYDRYMNADVAGEERDPRWILEDKSTFYADILERDLIASDDVKGAQIYYDGLRCSAIFGANEQEDLHSVLGTVAALMGRRNSIAAHFALVAASLDREGEGHSADSRAYFALNRAADWRRALIIAERKAAAPDVPINAPCR